MYTLDSFIPLVIVQICWVVVVVGTNVVVTSPGAVGITTVVSWVGTVITVVLFAGVKHPTIPMLTDTVGFWPLLSKEF